MTPMSFEGVFWLAMTPKQRSDAWERELAEFGSDFDEDRIRESVKCEVNVLVTAAPAVWAPEFVLKMEDALVPGCHLMSVKEALPRLLKAMGFA